jgi:ketosteroid isomerase-like protein
MPKIFMIAGFLTLNVALCAQQIAVHSDANPVADAEIKAVELKLAELVVRGDWDEYAKHLTSDYLYTRENGRVEDKAETLDGLRGVQGDVKRKIIVMELNPASLVIHTYGDTAVSNAEFTITVRDSGQVKSRRTRQTDVFVKREGQWWLVAGQGSTIGK